MIYRSVFQNRMKIITGLTTSDWPIYSYMDIKQRWQVNCLGKGLQVSFKTCYHHFDPQERTDHLNGWWAIGEDDITSLLPRDPFGLCLVLVNVSKRDFATSLRSTQHNFSKWKTFNVQHSFLCCIFAKFRCCFHDDSPKTKLVFHTMILPSSCWINFRSFSGATLRDNSWVAILQAQMVKTNSFPCLIM